MRRGRSPVVKRCFFMKFSRKQIAVVLGAMAAAVASGAAMADATVPTALTQGLTDQTALLLLVIAAGGGAMLTVAGGGVVWNVGAKFIKRLGGKA